MTATPPVENETGTRVPRLDCRTSWAYSLCFMHRHFGKLSSKEQVYYYDMYRSDRRWESCCIALLGNSENVWREYVLQARAGLPPTYVMEQGYICSELIDILPDPVGLGSVVEFEVLKEDPAPDEYGYWLHVLIDMVAYSAYFVWQEGTFEAPSMGHSIVSRPTTGSTWEVPATWRSHVDFVYTPCVNGLRRSLKLKVNEQDGPKHLALRYHGLVASGTPDIRIRL